MADYTYNVQYGDSEISEVDDRGAATPDEIIKAFDDFDWAGEVSKSNETEKCSPTFTVEDANSGRQLWVSACGEPSNFEFISFYCYPHRKKAWFGLVERDGFSGPECRQDLSLSEAGDAIRLFFEARHDQLMDLVSVTEPSVHQSRSLY